MEIKTIDINNIKLSVVESDEVVLKTEADAVDLMGNVESSFVVVNERNVTPKFFDLSTKIAGTILGKLSNYRVKLAIIGDFEKYPSKTLKDFIYECNKKRDHLFVKSMDEVKELWKDQIERNW